MSWSAVNEIAFEWIAIRDHPSLAREIAKAVALWPIFALPVLVAGLWVCGQRADRDAAIGAAVAALLAMFAAHVASSLIDHPRPFMLGLAPNILEHASDSSFPSDHATLFFALAGSFGSRPLSRLRRLGLALAAAGLAVGAARVALGVHFPFDVVGAAVIGAGCAAIVGTPLGGSPLARVVRLAERAREKLPGLPERGRLQMSSVSRGDARPAD